MVDVVVNPTDTGVSDTPGQAHLVSKSSEETRIPRELGEEGLDRDSFLESLVVGAIDPTHPALSDALLDHVAIGDPSAARERIQDRPAVKADGIPGGNRRFARGTKRRRGHAFMGAGKSARLS
jgi:hypothetical protein